LKKNIFTILHNTIFVKLECTKHYIYQSVLNIQCATQFVTLCTVREPWSGYRYCEW